MSFKGAASRELDSPVLAKTDLEADLLELYIAVSNKKANETTSIPLDVRLGLIEQMYLRVHQRKLPEIGVQSLEERAAVAEEWLLEHWPVQEDRLLHLAKERVETVRHQLQAAGVGQERLHVEPASIDDDGQADVRFKLLYSSEVGSPDFASE